jgi:tetratricopeptide (TPR) repeat protein
MVRLVRRARERPSDPELFAGLTYAARYCGLLQASVAASGHAARLDPAILTSAAHTFYLRRDYERALEFAADPYIRSLALVSLGREAEAAAVLERIDQSVAKNMVIYATALLQLIRHQHAESADTIRAVRRFPDPEGRYHVARHLARLGEMEEALSYLDEAVREFRLRAGIRARPLARSASRDPGIRHAHARRAHAPPPRDRQLHQRLGGPGPWHRVPL